MKILIRLLAKISLILFIGLTLLDIVYNPIFYKSEISSSQLALKSANRLLHFIERSPVAILGLIPGSFQVKIGLSIFLNSFAKGLDQNELNGIKNAVYKLYNDMDIQSEWKNLPSVTGYSALDLIGIPPQNAHTYIYLPDCANNHPKKAVLFFHGSLGNLKAYPYIWSKYADSTCSLIIAPTAGFGWWKGKEEIIDTVLENLPENLKVPPEDTIIAGLSAGGYAVANEMRRNPRYKAAVFISPVIPTELIDSSSFAESWHDKPVLIFGGEADFLITSADLKFKAEKLKLLNPKVFLYPEESHFLLVNKYREIFDQIDKVLMPQTLFMAYSLKL